MIPQDGSLAYLSHKRLCKDKVAGVFLLLSGQYVKGDLREIFGNIPPVFLPVNGKFLFEHQIATKPSDYELVLTLPKSYALRPRELAILNLHKAEVFWNSESNLEIAVANVLNDVVCGCSPVSVDILHGDTLIDDLPKETVAVTSKPEFYSWGEMTKLSHNANSTIFAGRITTSNHLLLIEGLKKTNDFTLTLDNLVYEGKLVGATPTQWLDFGNLITFLESKKRIAETRHFNRIEFSGDKVVKISEKYPEKIRGEIAWYRNLPPRALKYVPKLIEYSSNSYAIEFIPEPSMHDIFIYGHHELDFWKKFFLECQEYFSESLEMYDVYEVKESTIGTLENLAFSKTIRRIQSYPGFLFGESRQYGRIAERDLSDLFSDLKSQVGKNAKIGFFHGDLVLSNIFWKNKLQNLVFIDPRGLNDCGELIIFGDIRYDLAKMFQSIFLGYELILVAFFSKTSKIDDFFTGNHLNRKMYEDLLEEFSKTVCLPLGIDVREIAALAQLLLIGLVPLHSDRPDRQVMFVEIIKISSAWLKDLGL